MDANLYKAELARLDNETKQNLIDLALWAERDALPWLWNELAGIMPERRAAPLQPQDAIRQGLQTTISDREKMPLKASFYVAQLTMMDAEVTRYCDVIRLFAAAPKPFAEDAAIHTLHRALKAFLFDGIVLFEQAAHALLDLPAAYGAWSRRVEHPFEIFKGAEQVIYGTYSGLTHVDRAPFTPIAILRTAIEIRIRSAFGIQAYVDQSNNSLLPIDLGRVFDEVRNHVPAIQFAVDFHDVVKVYKWSNFYLHGGWRDFGWVPGYALQFLRPLFADQNATPTGGWSINGGIRLPRQVWRDIRNSFEPEARPHEPIAIIWEWIKSILPPRKKIRRLSLNPASEQDAQVVFLD